MRLDGGGKGRLQEAERGHSYEDASLQRFSQAWGVGVDRLGVGRGERRRPWDLLRPVSPLHSFSSASLTP